MKAIHHLYAAAAALVALTACSDIDDSLSAFRNDPNAVRITAQVGSVSGNFETRSNPLGDAEEQEAFNTGDEISVGADNQDAATYRYDADKREWTPTQGDKYLKWVNPSMTFKAYYPASFTGVVSQPSAYNSVADLQAADYMVFDGTRDNAQGNSLTLTMKRQMARVIVEIAGFGNEFAEGTEVNGVQLFANGSSVGAFKFNGRYYALATPRSANANGLFLALTVGADNKTKELHGVPELKAGMSYTYRLTVGKDKLTLLSVSVEPWSEETIPGARAYRAPDVSGNVITMYEAGALQACDVEKALGTGHALKIAGPMNDDDFATLKTYLQGLNIDENGTPIDIDLAEAEVKTIPDYALPGANIGYNTLGKVALPKSVETIDACAFRWCLKLNITNWEQLAKLRYIGNYAFEGCSALTGNVVLSGQSPWVGYRAFASTKITSISFPDGAKLRGSACYYCRNLEKIIFQGNVTFNESDGTNGVSAQFGYCTTLTTIDFSNCTTVPDISAANGTNNDAFSGVTRSGITLYVPIGMKAEFEAKGWTGFKINEAITLQSAGSLTATMLDAARNGGTFLKIAGPMNSADFTTLKTYLEGLNIDGNGTPIDIDLAEAEVKTIPENALHGLDIGYNTLGKVALPKSVETIGTSAFQSCKKLDVTNWEQLTKLRSIETSAFDGCSVLTGNVVLSGQSSSVGFRAFAFTKIRSISFPDGAKLDGSACGGCGNLEKIIFQGNVTFNALWGTDTNGVLTQFVYCTALTTIDFSNCTTVPDISAANNTNLDAFSGVTRSGITLYVPIGMKAEFEAKGWTGFTIVEQ